MTDQAWFAPSALLLATLLRTQFPQWARLAISEVASAGTDNAIYRLGPNLVARLPRNPGSVPALLKEQTWLPALDGKLPAIIPHLVARGEPSAEFPAPWSIYGWIKGKTYSEGAVADWTAFVDDLADFIQALQRCDAANAPAPGQHNFGRGAPLATRERRVQAAIEATAARFDAKTILAIWTEDSSVPAWNGPLRWLHGDLHAQNILLANGRLHAIIDFGCLGAGDPACELAVAWRLLPGHARERFRHALNPDTATWRRARAWALSISLMEVQAYATTNPVLTAIAARTIEEVLKDRLR